MESSTVAFKYLCNKFKNYIHAEHNTNVYSHSILLCQELKQPKMPFSNE